MEKALIRVRTLYLPKDDLLLSFILSNPDFEIIEKQVSPLVKTEQMLAYVEYKDMSGDQEDPFVTYKRELEKRYAGLDTDDTGELDGGLYDLFAEPKEKEETEEFIAPKPEQKKRGRKKKNDQ